jgi:hypothetical protein
MDTNQTDMTFEQWIQCLFEHSIKDPIYNPNVDLDSDWDGCEIDSKKEVEYIGRLFTSPMESLEGYTDTQIGKGLWILINEIEPYMYELFNEDIPVQMRVQVVKSMNNVFEQLFAPRCSDYLNHLIRAKEENHQNPLNSTCYMWWDIIPLYGKSGDSSRELLDSHCVGVMEHVLHLDSIACQESALHGLGHWKHVYPKRVNKIIDDFIEREKCIDDRLRQYALDARSGHVL